jgi:hypothetical protein
MNFFLLLWVIFAFLDPDPDTHPDLQHWFYSYLEQVGKLIKFYSYLEQVRKLI